MSTKKAVKRMKKAKFEPTKYGRKGGQSAVRKQAIGVRNPRAFLTAR